MYNPKHFEEARPEVLQALVREHALATLVTMGSDGLCANLIPLQWQAPGDLLGHVARANPLWQEADLAVPVLAIFQGPAHYISPSWYPTKQEHGKVVPTWNYAVVQARGVMRLHHDADWIRRQVSALTRQQEAVFDKPWAVDDAPREYTDGLLKALVGIEIQVTQWSGKWKVSQNQPANNRAGVVAALQGAPVDNAAQAMAALVQSRA
jgi:transcriptional regulator